MRLPGCRLTSNGPRPAAQKGRLADVTNWPSMTVASDFSCLSCQSFPTNAAQCLPAKRPSASVAPGTKCGTLSSLRAAPPAHTARGLFAVRRRAPSQLDAVVRVVCHFERRCAVDDVFERACPRGAVAARIRKLAHRKL